MLKKCEADKYKSKEWLIWDAGMMIIYLLNSINIVEGTILELSPTPREQEVVTWDLNPILMPLVLCELSVRNIAVPYLQKAEQLGNKQTYILVS